MKVSIRIVCARTFTAYELAEKLSLRCSARLLRNFVVIKSSGYSFVIFCKRGCATLHVNATGIPALHYVEHATHALIRLFEDCHIHISPETVAQNTTVDSISSKWKHGSPVDLNMLNARIKNETSLTCKCETQRFPGATVTHSEYGSCVIFSTGTILLWGQKKLINQRRLLSLLHELL